MGRWLQAPPGHSPAAAAPAQHAQHSCSASAVPLAACKRACHAITLMRASCMQARPQGADHCQQPLRMQSTAATKWCCSEVLAHATQRQPHLLQPRHMLLVPPNPRLQLHHPAAAQQHSLGTGLLGKGHTSACIGRITSCALQGAAVGTRCRAALCTCPSPRVCAMLMDSAAACVALGYALSTQTNEPSTQQGRGQSRRCAPLHPHSMCRPQPPAHPPHLGLLPLPPFCCFSGGASASRSASSSSSCTVSLDT